MAVVNSVCSEFSRCEFSLSGAGAGAVREAAIHLGACSCSPAGLVLIMDEAEAGDPYTNRAWKL